MENLDHILILKTDIQTVEETGLLELVFSSHPEVEQWTIDLEDVDRVLRVISPTLACAEITALLEPCGFYCSELE